MAKMEDVLETYALPYDPGIPMICMDEKPCQLLEHHLTPLPMEQGRARKEDFDMCAVAVAAFLYSPNH